VAGHSKPAHTASPALPVLVIVDADPQAGSATEAVLVRRFEPDYHIVTADSATTGLAVLQKLASQGAEVAIVAADLKLPGMDGVAFLELAHELHRDASRVLLLAMDRYHTQIPLSELATLQQATALGRIDFWIVKGWVTPVEWLYLQVQDALSAWTIAHRSHLPGSLRGPAPGSPGPPPRRPGSPTRAASRRSCTRMGLARDDRPAVWSHGSVC
jgi:thioredoxin reductase (NADPH)